MKDWSHILELICRVIVTIYTIYDHHHNKDDRDGK